MGELADHGLGQVGGGAGEPGVDASGAVVLGEVVGGEERVDPAGGQSDVGELVDQTRRYPSSGGFLQSQDDPQSMAGLARLVQAPAVPGGPRGQLLAQPVGQHRVRRWREAAVQAGGHVPLRSGEQRQLTVPVRHHRQPRRGGHAGCSAGG
ncbi:hypothetical protein [Streptomyces flaveolus]|uniref:hypothetical protein n=1 Tax=Streptomyces flaveolus TaxID=67297 RepID=UPI00381CD61E